MASPRTPTDMQVRSLKARKDRQYLKLFSEGFGVRVSPTTETKTFVYWYSFKGGKRLLTLGRYGAITLKEALAKHGEARAAVLRGEDPAGAKAKAKAESDRAPTVQLLVDEFAAQVLAKQASGSNTLRQIHKDVLPRLKPRTPLADLRRRDAVVIVDAVRKRGDRIGNAAAAVLTRLGNFAVERGLLDANPFTALKKTRLDPKTRVLADWELERLLSRLNSVDLDPGTALALLLVLVTGQRPGEVAGMRQDEVNGDVWTIPASRYKTGLEHRVPLSPLALDVLRHAATYNAGSAYVFPSPRPGAAGDRAIDRHSLSRAVLRKLGEAPDDPKTLTEPADGTLGLAPFTPHDLRRTCRTGMAALGVPDPVAEKVLGHRLEGMLAVYNTHEYLDEKRDALNRWAAHIQSVMNQPKSQS